MQPLMQSPPGPITKIDGRDFLYFGGTSYLGLAARESVIEAGVEALRKYGVHTATSRTGYGYNPPNLEVEEEAARFFGKPAAFYFGSGYMSNHILVSLALKLIPDAKIYAEATSHFCVLEASRLGVQSPAPFEFNNMDRFQESLQREVKDPVIVMADAVSPVTGRLAPVMDLIQAIERGPGGILILDDAHGVGVLGESGRGRLEMAGVWDRVNTSLDPATCPVFMGATLSKALGGFGGIIAGSEEFIRATRTASDYFGGASAPATAEAACTAEALRVVQREPELRQRLRENSLRLRAGLRRMGLTPLTDPTAHLGLALGSQESMLQLHERLKERGILLPYISRYVGIPASGAMRFAVFANHAPEQIDQLLAELEFWIQ